MREREKRNRDTEKSSNLPYTSLFLEKITTAKAGSSSRFPTWVARTHSLDPSPAAPRVHISRKLDRARHLRDLNQIWDVQVSHAVA